MFTERRRAGMEHPASQGRPRPGSRQLALPLTSPGPGQHPPPLPVATLQPRQVWASLGPTEQAQVQRVLLRIVQEVVHERKA